MMKTTSSSNTNNTNPSVILIIIVLMYPKKKFYKIMILYIDSNLTITIGCILYKVQQQLLVSDSYNCWREDYDGIYQLCCNRNLSKTNNCCNNESKFCQMINVLDIQKYDLYPYKIYVAKPWAMSSESA